ncbi:DUF3953 domain-containing protein [Ornithinibacillus salinisoli]|uniref:DUF3953 domain-containing protein n=1 Tax=Ornithinibacillus salinisoli TaxID=1848459 RepID=UPI003632F728
MLKFSRIILAVIGLLLSGYGLLARRTEVLPYLMFVLGLIILVIGLEAFQKRQKVYGWINIIAFLTILFVVFQGLLFH